MAEANDAVLVTVDDAVRDYDFGAAHPLRPERVLLTYGHIEQLGFHDLPGLTQLRMQPVGEDAILRAHDSDYVEMVKALGDGREEPSRGLRFGLGTRDNPIFEKMHTASVAVCSATSTAARAVASGEASRAFNPAGGLHHARRREASGFCIYNDPAVAIYEILEIQPDWRVMYLDVDVHHGDGVQGIFYSDPRVLTLSLHQSDRYLYPGTGFENEIGIGDARGTSANVPFLSFAGENDYLWALETVLDGLAAAFKPDVLVTQLGADTHHGDPLADLALTMRAFPAMAQVIEDAVLNHCSGRWVATGGGGYQAETVVPKVWTMHFAQMCGAPELIPQEWLDDVDPSTVARPQTDGVKRSVDTVLASCVPLLSALRRH
jgi:acetoin utilization protein AcuC